MTAMEIPILAIDLPVMYEDEGQENMGDSWPHSFSQNILSACLIAHFDKRNETATVISNMSLYYHSIDRWAYVSPDVMVLPVGKLSKKLKSYRIGQTGPAPLLTVEVLSERTFQQGDLTLKPRIYADLGVREYLLVDVTGDYLPQRLVLKTLIDDAWDNQSDQGSGVVSALGFRVIITNDDEVRIVDEASGKIYRTPHDYAFMEREIERLKAENARLKSHPPTPPGS